MSIKKSVIAAVPSGSFFAKREEEDPRRKRAVSDEYLRDEAAEKAIEDADLDELVVPGSEPPEGEYQESPDGSDVHDLMIEPSEVPVESAKPEVPAKASTEQAPVKRGRFFSSISSALIGVVQKPGASQSEIEKSLREALERSKKKQ